ncbi:MAG: DNA polymerase III subunit chi [Chlamydiia bacterium]|nr:DNA polymerase III subunit chi [Chlamydiia bacterium]
MISEQRVILFQVRDNSAKISKIIETATLHFERKEKMVFFVDDGKALQYLDELLWKTPPSSFLPHVAIDMPCSDYLVLTTTKQSLNEAKIGFNLCATPLLLDGLKILYDFEDLTTSSKQTLSTNRFNAYKLKRYAIEARP